MNSHDCEEPAHSTGRSEALVVAALKRRNGRRDLDRLYNRGFMVTDRLYLMGTLRDHTGSLSYPVQPY
jgi:hypothetical protein